MTARRAWWLLFWTGAAIVAGALVWVSTVLLELERRETDARADARRQEALRLSLYRMDFWFAPRLAREAARPYFEYLAFYPQERAYTRILNEIEKGDVLTPSPLLDYRSEFFTLYFQVNADGSILSPQVPVQSQRDLAESHLVSGTLINEQAARLEALRGVADWDALNGRVGRTETRIAAMTCEASQARASQIEQTLNAPLPQQGGEVQEKWQQARSQQEYSKRMASSNMAQKQPVQQSLAPDELEPNADSRSKGGMQTKSGVSRSDEASAEATVTIGPFVGLWLEKPSKGDPKLERSLVFVRRVQAGDRECLQGFLVDWPRLRDAMLEQVSGLIEQASLQPNADIVGTDQATGRELASIPVTLVTASPQPVAAAGLTPARLTLTLTWLAALGAIAAAGLSLRSSIHYGQKRSRFASAVTHELRTPLTTFRMYSEMLAEGMVRDEDQRQTYLRTLQRESGRLATLVENVLAYARLEDGRAVRNLTRTTVSDLVERSRDVLERRASEAGMTLGVSADDKADSTMLTIDVDAVGQILFNLVDNACKYAAGADDRTISLAASIDGDRAALAVSDRGPGVAPEHARRIFAPFDRGAHGPGDTIPGVGLGLALSRGLAQDLGGDLTLEPSPQGACFRLTLPIDLPSGEQ